MLQAAPLWKSELIFKFFHHSAWSYYPSQEFSSTLISSQFKPFLREFLELILRSIDAFNSLSNIRCCWRFRLCSFKCSRFRIGTSVLRPIVGPSSSVYLSGLLALQRMRYITSALRSLNAYYSVNEATFRRTWNTLPGSTYDAIFSVQLGEMIL